MLQATDNITIERKRTLVSYFYYLEMLMVNTK